MNQILILVIGQSASGKTTIAKQLESDLQISRLSGDDFRDFLKQHILYLRNWDTSTVTDLGISLRPLTINYRLELVRVLLGAGQSVILDGSGFKKADRQPILDIAHQFPAVKVVAVVTELPEDELLARLDARKGNWSQTYKDTRKASFEPPTTAEVDLLLTYNQRNFDEIRQQITDFMS